MYLFSPCCFVTGVRSWDAALAIANIFFVAVFALEAALRIAAVGFRVYFFELWNRFDFAVAVVAVIGLAVQAGVGANAIRVVRLFRLIKRAKSLQTMFKALVLSLPALWNIGSLVLVILYVFAILGTLFCKRFQVTSRNVRLHVALWHGSALPN